jgi:hypothetical protein
VPSDGEGHQKSCEQGHVESDGREVASMRGESQNSKICGAGAHPIEAAGQFKFGFFLTTAASKILAPLARGFFFCPVCFEQRRSQSCGLRRGHDVDNEPKRN